MNYGEFLRKIKPYCINKNMNNEFIVNEPIRIIIEEANIRKEKGDNKGELFHYEITESSRIINNKLELSPKIRDALIRYGMEEIIIEEFGFFYEDYIDKNLLSDLILDFTETIKNDKSFLKNEINEIINFSNKPGIFLGKIMIKSLKEPNLISNCLDSNIWQNGENYIKVIKGDLLSYAFGKKSKKERIVVIPVNTCFDVHITTKLEKTKHPLVSINTLHGDFLSRLYKGGAKESKIKKRILSDLNENGYSEKDESYPIGTIASLDLGKPTIYLLAISTFDKNNNAYSSEKEIKTAIKKLIDYYNKKGQGYEIFVPLIGTGMSRAGLDSQESLDLIINSLLEKGKFLQGKFNIVIKPETFKSLVVSKERYYD